ncbi:unnamed protein product [Paramecium primaurelia]|uniref:Uncharacterized protein n=1 Tax=Paramecium primaurelia TaxID=5886 RepID=A0A8S1QVJ2_PARPR|nr:unnamed protein product [Paramecium primaurelia]
MQWQLNDQIDQVYLIILKGVPLLFGKLGQQYYFKKYLIKVKYSYEQFRFPILSKTLDQIFIINLIANKERLRGQNRNYNLSNQGDLVTKIKLKFQSQEIKKIAQQQRTKPIYDRKGIQQIVQNRVKQQLPCQLDKKIVYIDNQPKAIYIDIHSNEINQAYQQRIFQQTINYQ